MARTRKQDAARPRGATAAQLREAERGLRHVLALEFSARWIAQNLDDLLNQANVEYAEWLIEHGPATNPPGWLIQRGRWRALNLAKGEGRRSGPPLDSVIHTAEDPDPSPEDAVLGRDRQRRIERALTNIPEDDRRLIALVYHEGLSIRAAGRLLGWGKSNADKHHAKAMERLRTLLGPRDLLSPSTVGLVAQTMVLRDRGRIAGGLARRLTASVQDLGAFVARAFNSLIGSPGETARRVLPLSDAGAAMGPGGAGRAIAQCGGIATAAICSALVVASPPVEHLVGHQRPTPGPSRVLRARSRPGAAEPTPPESKPSAESRARSSAVAREAEARRIERRRRNRVRRETARRRRRAKISHARQARRRRAKARAAAAKRNESLEAPVEEVAPETTEPTTEPVVPEETAPPPATGAQTREEFGHL